MFYVCLMVTAKQKPTVNTQKIKGRKSNKACHYRKSSVHKRRQQKRRKETRGLRNTIKQQDGIKFLSSNNYFTVNILNSTVKRHIGPD